MIKKASIKIISLLMVILFIIPLVVACGETVEKPEDSTYSGIGADTDEKFAEKTKYNPEIPKKDYNKYDFGIIVQPYNEGLAYSNNFIDADGVLGEYLNDAVYNRNSIVEEKYNITISKIETANILSTVRTQVMSGMVEFDMIVTRCLWLATLARENHLADLLSYEWFDMTKPYWDTNGMRDLMIGEKLYFTNSDFVAQELASFIYFNKQIIEDYQLKSPYEYMAENNWTLDTFAQLSKSIYKDANNNGLVDEYDQFGLLAEHHNARALLFGSEIRTTTNDATGYPVVTLMSDKTVTAYEKIKAILSDQTSWCITCMPNDSHGFTDKWDYMRSWFCQDMFLFHIEGANIIEQFADMESEFGIVPIPKYDSTQANYASSYPMHCSLMALPTTATDTDMVGRIVEDLNYYSSITVMPTFYDTVLARKSARDDESEKNLDIIKNSRVYDLGVYFDFGGVRSKITDVDATKNNISTNFAKLKKAIDADIAATYEKFAR